MAWLSIWAPRLPATPLSHLTLASSHLPIYCFKRVPICFFSIDLLPHRPSTPNPSTLPMDSNHNKIPGPSDPAAKQPTRLEEEKSFRQQQFQRAALEFLRGCPGDWQAGNQTRLKTWLRRFGVSDDQDYIDQEEHFVRNALQFRKQVIQYADDLVEAFCSSRAADEDCFSFCLWLWQREIAKLPYGEPGFFNIYQQLVDGGCEFRPNDDRNTVFPRPLQYIAASIIHSTLSDPAARAPLVQKFISAITHQKEVMASTNQSNP